MVRQVCPECGNVCDSEDGFCAKCGREFKKADEKSMGTYSLSQQAPVEVPDDMSVEDMMAKGFELIALDSYTDAAAYWVKAVSKGYVPDDETYQRMLTETGSAMLRISDHSNVVVRKGAADLSMVLDDRDFSTDLLAQYASRVPDCTGQVMLVNLSTNYLVLMMESFSIYSDLRDLQQMCLNAQLFIKAVYAREEELKGDGSLDVEKAMKFIGTNSDYVNVLESKITHAINTMNEAELDKLGDYWSEQTDFPYMADLMVALQLSIQLRVTGRFSSKMFVKTRDGQVDRFLVKYVAPSKR